MGILLPNGEKMSPEDREEERDDVAGVPPEEVGFEHGDMNDDRPHTHEDELLDAFGEGSHTPIVTDPDDGLPRPADNWIAPAPKLSSSSFICMEDESSYVEMFQEDTSMRNVFLDAISKKPQGARDIMSARRSAYDEKGEPVQRRTFKPEQVVEKFGIKVAQVFKTFVPVMPVRPRCSNLVRQIIDSSDVDAGGIEVRPMFTYCKAFKSVSGAYLSLMDRAIYSCEHRNPRDLITEKEIVDRIRNKIKQGEERHPVVPFLKKEDAPNPFEGEETYDQVIAEGPCSAVYAPGRRWRIRIVNPSAWKGPESNVLYFGRHVTRDPFAAVRRDVSFHSILSGEGDYAPEEASPEELKEFCESWPIAAEFEYLSTNLVNTPRFLADRLVQGEDLAVCAKSLKDARFAAYLVTRALGMDTLEPHYIGLRPEHVSYLKRTNGKTKE